MELIHLQLLVNGMVRPSVDELTNDKLEILQKASPPLLLREDSEVKHVGVCEDDFGFFSNGISDIHGGISIKRFYQDMLKARHVGQNIAKAALLVLSQCFGGEDIQGP
jgi:hypothetical protein